LRLALTLVVVVVIVLAIAIIFGAVDQSFLNHPSSKARPVTYQLATIPLSGTIKRSAVNRAGKHFFMKLKAFPAETLPHVTRLRFEAHPYQLKTLLGRPMLVVILQAQVLELQFTNAFTVWGSGVNVLAVVVNLENDLAAILQFISPNLGILVVFY
jgi:hypothetical protein